MECAFYRARPRRRRVWNKPVKFARRRSDGHELMLVRTPPMSNVERQRLFRARHPGYDRRYKARIPGLNAIGARPAPLMQPVSQPATPPAHKSIAA